MKQVTILIFIILIASGCGLKQNSSMVTNTKKHFLDGLTEMDPEDKDSLARIGLFRARTVPFYTADGKMVPQREKMAITSSGDYNIKIYEDASNTVKLWLLEPYTEEQRKKLAENQNLMHSNQSPLIGKPAPDFSITDMSGTEIRLSDLKGKVVVLNFWFTACYPCISEMPELNGLVEKFKDKEVVFIAPALEDSKKLNSFLAKHDFRYQIIPDAKKIHALYKIKAYPTHMVIDKNSIVRFDSGMPVGSDDSPLERAIIKNLGDI